MTRFLPYGVDKQVTVTVTKSDSLAPISRTKIRDGVLTLSRYRIYETKYAFDHKGSNHISSLYIEHKYFKSEDYSLFDSAEPCSKTENFLRFKTRVNAGEITIFKIKERKMEHDSHNLRGIAREKIEEWFNAKYISKAIRDTFVNQLIPLKSKINNQNTAVSELTTQMQKLLTEQASNSSSINSRLQSSSNSYYSGNLWYYNEVSDDVLSQSQKLIDGEATLRKLRANLKVEQDRLAKDQTKFESDLVKLVEELTLNI